MNPNLLDELIVLFMLGELSPNEMESLENDIPKSLQKDYLDTFHSLAYTVPQVHISPNLKAKVLAKVASESADFVPQRLENLTWKPHPVVKGVDLALLFTDTLRQEASYLVRCQANTTYPAHQHYGTEKIMILDGEMEVEGEVFGKGDFLISHPGSIHAPKTPKGCLFYVHTSLNDRFVEWNPAMIWQFLFHRR